MVDYKSLSKSEKQDLLEKLSTEHLDDFTKKFENIEYKVRRPGKMPLSVNEKINTLIDEYFADSPFTLLEIYKTDIRVLNKSTYQFNIIAYARDDKGQIRPGVLRGYINTSRPKYTYLSNAHWYNAGELDEYTGEVTHVFRENHLKKE